MKFIHFILISLLLNSCSHLGIDNEFSDKSLIGKDISYAIKQLELKTGKYFVIAEPPGVPRGIYGKDKHDHKVRLFIKRGDVPFSERYDWKLEDFSNKKIIGTLRQRSMSRDIYGETPFIYSH